MPALKEAAPLLPLKLVVEEDDAGAPVEEPEEPEPEEPELAPVVEAPVEEPEGEVAEALAPLLAPEVNVVLTEAETPVLGA